MAGAAAIAEYLDSPKLSIVEADLNDHAALVALVRAGDRIVSLNRSTLKKLTETLDSGSGRLLGRYYDRAAFPGVFLSPFLGGRARRPDPLVLRGGGPQRVPGGARVLRRGTAGVSVP